MRYILGEEETVIRRNCCSGNYLIIDINSRTSLEVDSLVNKRSSFSFCFIFSINLVFALKALKFCHKQPCEKQSQQTGCVINIDQKVQKDVCFLYLSQTEIGFYSNLKSVLEAEGGDFK